MFYNAINLTVDITLIKVKFGINLVLSQFTGGPFPAGF